MDDLDRTLEALKVQIKKEIVDNYFAERVYLEGEVQALAQEVDHYREHYNQAARLFQAFYQALGGSEAVIRRVMQFLRVDPWPGYEEYRRLPGPIQAGLLRGRARRGLTARRRRLHLILDLYDELRRLLEKLSAEHGDILVHLRLLNEDIDKFNLSFDFGLIAAQIEAMEGGPAVIAGGLQAGEREELSTRMRLKRRSLSPAELPPPPPLPPLKEVKGGLTALL
ncbi:MAG: hypothetical protein FJ128_00420 [Deltaproteobacteria bacterium]|nr:hypothetical protein [Deltaproteobacteria bacterium]